jgi:hypothetical protein
MAKRKNYGERKQVFVKNPNPKRILSWGFGVQSTAIGVMSCLGDLERLDYIIGCDLGNEHPVTYLMMDYYKRFFEKYGIPTYIIKTDPIFSVPGDMPLWLSTGGHLNRNCTFNLKIRPFRMKIRELLGLRMDNKGRVRKSTAIAYLGISYDEAHRMKESRLEWLENYFPLVERKITRNDCIEYFKKHNLPIPPKSGCSVCPFRGKAHLIELKEKYPEEFEKVVEFDKFIRNQKYEKNQTGQLFISNKLIPIEDLIQSQPELDNTDTCETGYCFF